MKFRNHSWACLSWAAVSVKPPLLGHSVLTWIHSCARVRVCRAPVPTTPSPGHPDHTCPLFRWPGSHRVIAVCTPAPRTAVLTLSGLRKGHSIRPRHLCRPRSTSQRPVSGRPARPLTAHHTTWCRCRPPLRQCPRERWRQATSHLPARGLTVPLQSWGLPLSPVHLSAPLGPWSQVPRSSGM